MMSSQYAWLVGFVAIVVLLVANVVTNVLAATQPLAPLTTALGG